MSSPKGATWRVDFSNYLETAAKTAKRTQRPRLRQRVVRDGPRYYYVVDANALLEHQSREDPARPGHPTG